MARRDHRQLFSRFVAIMVGLPLMAAIAFLLYFFHAILMSGPTVWQLSADDRVAYLILADQLAPVSPVADATRQGWPIPVVVGSSIRVCGGASDELIAALKKSGADKGLKLIPLTCGSRLPKRLFVGTGGERYAGGVSCGPLCGRGNEYQVWHFLGLVRIQRVGSFVM